ncbi:MAG: YceD family protein [Coriobacteriia bacterium]
MERTYPLDLTSILDEVTESLHVEDDVDLGTIEVGSSVFHPDGPAHVDVFITNAGEGIVASGSVTATVHTECVRCLQPFALDVRGEVEGYYVTGDEVEQVPEEQEYELISAGAIDLMPALLSAIALELPFAPLHDPDCAGICPACGADLSEGQCSCEPDEPESPFTALRGLFDEAEE